MTEPRQGGRGEWPDHEDRINLWCQMCGAAPGEPCTVISGTGESGDRPGDTRPEPHFYRASAHKPAVLIPDEPPISPVDDAERILKQATGDA